MLLLVFAHRHLVGFVDEDIRRHERRVGQQSGIHVVRVLTHLVLERGHTLQFAEIGVHVEEEVELDGFGQVALQIYRSLVRIESGGEVGSHYLAGVAVDAARCGVGGQRVVVGDEEIAVVFLLHLHEVAQRSEVVAQMQVASRADAAADDVSLFHILSFLFSFVTLLFSHRLTQIVCAIFKGFEGVVFGYELWNDLVGGEHIHRLWLDDGH